MELQDFQPSQLLSLLAQETIGYYKLIGDGASVEECTQCNNRIKSIQSELDSRKDPQERIFFQREHISVTTEYTI